MKQYVKPTLTFTAFRPEEAIASDTGFFLVNDGNTVITVYDIKKSSWNGSPTS